MSNRDERKKQSKSAEARDLGTDSNPETCAYFKGSVPSILTQPYSGREKIGEPCGRCGETGQILIPQKGRSLRLCWTCTVNPSARDVETISASAIDDSRGLLRPIRLYQCFGCGNSYAADLMSAVLVLCKVCRRLLRGSDRCQGNATAEKISLRVSRFLRRCL